MSNNVTKWLLRQTVSLLLFYGHLLSMCEGSHYIKCKCLARGLLINCHLFSNRLCIISDHMSDYCDSDRMEPVILSPNGNMTSLLIKLKRETYVPNMNCTLSLRAPPNYGLMAFITKLKLRRITSHQMDKLEFSSNNQTLLRMHGLNQEVVPRKTILTGMATNQLDIHFMSENVHKSLAGKGFKIIVNLYTSTLLVEVPELIHF